MPPPMCLPDALPAVFTRDALRLPAREWRKLRKQVGQLPDAAEAAVQELRRKSMSCVYAERSRERRRSRTSTLPSAVLAFNVMSTVAVPLSTKAAAAVLLPASC